MDNIDLNSSPDLTLHEIINHLFNNNTLSDIRFRVEGKILFAHSWILIQRSVVFREQFIGNAGDNKLIPIEDSTYKVFYQFLRFLYTDEFNIAQEMRCEILKLAVKYKIVKLETRVLNLVGALDTALELFEFSVVNKYELGYYYLDYLFKSLDDVLKLETFVDIHYVVVEKILKSDQMPSGVREIQLFDRLVDWINKSCDTNKTPSSQRRSHFDKLLRLIRFPIMTTEEFRLCVKLNPDLFTSEDTSTICKQILLGSDDQNRQWISEPRLEYSYPIALKLLRPIINTEWKTKFTVSNCLILRGLRYGNATGSNYEIHISGINRIRMVTGAASFKFESTKVTVNTFSFGEAIKLKPNVEYTIEIKFINSPQIMALYYRKPDISCIVTGPSNLVTFTKISVNLFEIFFTLPKD